MENLFYRLKNDPSYAIRQKKRAEKLAVKFFVPIIRLLVLLAIGYIILYPLLYMIVTSLKARSEYYTSGRVWLPFDINPKYNYSMAMDLIDYFGSLKSTLVFEIVAAILEIITCSVAAYGFARFKFKLKGIMMAGLFLTIIIPEAMMIIPRMVTYSNLDFLGILGLINKVTGLSIRINLIGTPWAFYLPSLFASGLRSGILIFIYIQFFKGLPKELEEAAWVDGAGPIKTFIRIALPSSSVVFTTVTVFAFVWHWNDTLLANMYIMNASHQTLSVMLSRIQNSFTGVLASNRVPETQSMMMAACILFIAPLLIFYMIAQKKFIESIDRVGITG